MMRASEVKTMDWGNHDETRQKTPDPKLLSPRCEVDWKKIAEELSVEQDGAKLLELTNRLIEALDSQQGAA
jgi:hypothetical protein